MRNIYLLALFLLSLAVFPQGVPAGINYQGVARNAAGDPITTPISVKVEIHQGSSNGGVVCSEVFPNVNPNPFGVFALQIGTVSPAQFSAITWSTGTFFVGVSIDPNNGTSFGTEVSNQKLMSVPYALYAEKSGNPASNINITSSNPAINVTSTPPNYLINYVNPILTYADSSLRIVQGTYSSSPVYIRSASGASTLLPASNTWTNNTPANVILTNSLANVGIGTPLPSAKLSVITNPSSSNDAILASSLQGNGILAITTSTGVSDAAIMASNSGNGSGVVGTAIATTGNIAGVIGQNTGAGPGVIGSNMNFAGSGMAHGVYGETNSNNPFVGGVTGSNSGSGPGVYGDQALSGGGSGVYGSSSSSISAGVFGINSGGNAGVRGEVTLSASLPNAHGVYGKTAANSASATGVFGENKGIGAGVYGLQSSFSNSSTAHGVKGETNSLNGSAAGVIGINSGSGFGVIGIQSNAGAVVPAVVGDATGSSGSASANGVFGRTNSTNSGVAAVQGHNIGAGHGVMGLATSSNINTYGVYARNVGTGGGVLAEAFSTFSLTPAVHGNQFGIGPALKGTIPTVTAAGSSNVALLIENGHFQATSANSPIITATLNNTGVTVNGVSLAPGSNDVRGMITLTVQSNTAQWLAFGSLEITLQFNKPYMPGGPWVICTKHDESTTAVEVKTTATTFVVFKVKNPFNFLQSPNGPTNVLRFNYMIMQ